MYSGGESSPEHSSADERDRDHDHQSRHSRATNNGRRAPVDLPDDDDSDDDRRRRRSNHSRNRSPAGGSSSKRRSSHYDDEDDEDDDDNHHHRNSAADDDRHNKTRGRDDNDHARSSRRTDEDEYDDEDDDIKPHRNSSAPGGGKSGGSRSRDDDLDSHRRDRHDVDDYDDDDRHGGSDDDERHDKYRKKSSSSSGQQKRRPSSVTGKKRAHSDDEFDDDDDRHDRRDRDSRRRERDHDGDDDDEDRVEKEKPRKIKRERYDDGEDEIRVQHDRSERHVDNRYHDDDDHGADEEVRKTDLDNGGDQQGKNMTFDKAVEKSKASRRRNEPNTEVVEQECVSFLERMRKARDDDLHSFQRGEPALEKIKMLRDVERMMTKVHHREYLLDNMLLAAFRSWMDRLPDGSLPNLQVRSTLLQLLHDLRIDDDWVDRLESSQGLGKVIHFLSKRDDHEPNKRLAEKIMMKWARPVYRMNSSFQDLLYEFDKPDEGHRAGKESMAAERKAAMRTVQRLKTTEEKLRESRKGKEDTRIMASAPRPTPFLFTTVAEGTTQMSEKMAREIKSSRAKQKKMSRTISNLRRLTKGTGAKGSRPSINGR